MNSAVYLPEHFYFIPSEENRTLKKEKELQKVGGEAGAACAVLHEPRLGLRLEWRGMRAAGMAGVRPEET